MTRKPEVSTASEVLRYFAEICNATSENRPALMSKKVGPLDLPETIEDTLDGVKAEIAMAEFEAEGGVSLEHVKQELMMD